MLEESISSSPCKSKKSIRKLRCTRRSKRKGQACTNHGIEEGKMSSRILQHLYDSDGDSPEKADSRNTKFMPDSVVAHFRPFRTERLLCCGDRSSSSRLVNSKNVPIAEPSGFLPCLTTLENERNKVPIVDNCWHHKDEMLLNTPNKRLRLVNSILEDFALSPYKENSIGNSLFLEYSPEFVLKSKPRITYSYKRRNKQRVDCNKRLDFSSNDNGLSDSSSISVEENHSLLHTSSTTDVPDTTERLCANLLNLSAYYTQAYPELGQRTAGEFKADSETMDFFPVFSNVVSLVQEIISLRETSTHRIRKCSSYSSSQDFYGFPEMNSDPDDENETKLLYNRCCTSDVTSLSPICSQKLGEGPEMFRNMEAKKGEEFDEWNEDYMEIFAFIKTPPHSCKPELIKPADVAKQSRDNVCTGFKTAALKQIPISEDAQTKAAGMLKNLPEIIPNEAVKRDIYNTTMQGRKDIGINDSQIINRSLKCIGINELYDKPSTSKAALKMNMEYERRGNFVCDSTAQHPNKVKAIGTPSKQLQYSTKNTTSEEVIFNNFISNKLSFSENTEECVNKTFKELDSIRHDVNRVDLNVFKGEINQNNFLNSTQESKVVCPTDSNANTEVPSFRPNQQQKSGKSANNIGFQTASGKNIRPTSKALKSVEKLLKEFQSGLEPFDENSLELMKNEINLKQCKQSTSDITTINVEQQNKLWAEEADLANVIFSEWPLEEQLRAQKSQTIIPAGIETKQKPLKSNTSNTGFEGFRTAGGKNVSISEKGKKMAETLLQKIKNDCDTKDLLEIKNSIHKKNSKTIVAHKPMIVQNDSALMFKEISTCQETVDGCNPAQYKHLHSSKTCQSNTTNSFTELSVKSPLSVSVTNSIIARKNLLSLSRRRKGSGLVSPTRGTNGNPSAGTTSELIDDHVDTPNKMQSSINNITHVLQTPSTPNGNEKFFNASKCSTPRLEASVISAQNIEEDFKPISWNDKSISRTCSNTKFNSPNPSVSDRIARLRMYGEAPPISPILTSFQSNCRSSGLRPTRSMLKKAENK